MRDVSTNPTNPYNMASVYTSRLLLVLTLVTSVTYQGAVSMVMSVPRPRTSQGDAVAMVMKAGDETKLRLLLERPDSLFDLIASRRSGGSENEDLLRGSKTSHLWVAIDSDYDNNLFYVIDRQAQVITVVDYGRYQAFDIPTGISAKAQALAINWIDDVVYWTDAAYDAIFRYRGTGSCRHDECVRTVISTGLDTPTGLAVHPHRHFLFWTDVRGTVGKLERSDLHGGDRIVLFEQLSRPSAVAIDYSEDRVYWLAESGDVSVVETCTVDGGDRYSAALFGNIQPQDLEVVHGLLMLAVPEGGGLVMHDVTTNVTRRLWSGDVYGVCLFSPEVQNSGSSSQIIEVYTERDLLQEGFLILVSHQGSVSILGKMAVTATRDITTTQIVSRESVTAISVDVTNRFLYFFDRTNNAIERLSLKYLMPNSTDQPEVKVITKVPGSVAGLATDWLSGTVYWTDNIRHRVDAVTQDGSHVRCMAWQDVDQPRDIAVHPIRSLLFWTDVEDRNPRIERIHVRDMRRDVFLRLRQRPRPMALSIDFKDDTIYWSEGPRLCRKDLEGRGLEQCTSPSDHMPLAVKSLDILHDFIVWTNLKDLHVADKDDNFQSAFNNSRVMVRDAYYSDLLYFHPSRQPHSANPCANNNGGCAHFCLPVSASVSQCACATGYWSRRNGSCVSGFVEDHFVLVTDPLLGGIYQQYLYVPDYYAIAVKHVQVPSDVVYDRTTRKIYWSDTGIGAISRAYLNGSEQEVVFAHSEIVADKLFLDDGQQLLFFIDTTKQRVGVISLETKLYKIIVRTFQFVYHDIAVDSANGQIYLSASISPEHPSYISDDVMMSSDVGSILRCYVNGSDMSEILTTDGAPRGIVLSGEVLYWMDAGYGTLNALNTRTGNTSLLAQLPDWSKPDDVALLGDYVYWTDVEYPTLCRLKLEEGEEVEETGQPVLFQLSSIESYSSDDAQQHDHSPRHESRDLCREHNTTSSECLSVSEAIEAVRQREGFCRVAELQNGRVLTLTAGAYVTSSDVIAIECLPGYGKNLTRSRHFTAVCQNGSWVDTPACVWAMAYNISGSSTAGFYVVLTTSTDFIVPDGVTHMDVLAIGGGGGGMHACSPHFADVRRARDGGASRVGRYLRAGGGTGGRLHSGGRGGFGTGHFGGAGEISSRCLGGGAAGQTTWSGDCRLGSTRCPFCGAGGAPTRCSLCRHREGGRRGPWALARKGINADAFGGGATGLSGGGGGGGGGYSRRIVDVTPGEVIPVTVGRGGSPSAGNGVVVMVWGGRLEDVIPTPGPVTSRPFTFTADVSTSQDSEWGDSCEHGSWGREP